MIEIELKPENDMTVICDCVGILKERNVDVEHRLGRSHSLASSVTRNKKKSTKCRMVFRAKINDDSNFTEILQICSNTITCTQPPGVPEISKKSLDSCSVLGGEELFIIGKNFLKDTKVSFVRFDESRQPKKLWEETVQPDKEYLQQTHLICIVPPLANSESVHEPVHVQIYVTSSSKKSEAHNFVYMPVKKSCSLPQSPVSVDQGLIYTNTQETSSSAQQQQLQSVMSLTWNESKVSSTDNMMPPPLVMPRKPSFSKNLSDTSTSEAPITLKTEYIDQTQHLSIDSDALLDETTSTPAGLQTTSPVTMFNTTSLIVDNGLQNPFVTQDAQTLMTSSQVQDIFEGFKMEPNERHIELLRIKNEQSPEHVIASSAMLPSPQPRQEMNSAQQQVVENFLNLIVQSTVMSEPELVTQNSSHHHLTQDIILNSPSTVTPSSNVVIQNEQLVNSPPNLMLNSAIASSPMMCEPNLMTVQMVQDDINSIENSTASSIVSNAVSDATAETQAVVKQMIAQVAAEMLSENSTESQTSINNFISNTLGTNMMTQATEQHQLANTQQLQEMLAQELNAATSNLMLDVTKKEPIA